MNKKVLLIIFVLSALLLFSCNKAVDNSTGGNEFCKIHSDYYHMIPQEFLELIPEEEWLKWEEKAAEEMKTNENSCGGNIVSFIHDYKLTKEQIESAMQGNSTLQAMYPIDVIFNDNQKIIDEYYSYENAKTIDDKINNSLDIMFKDNKKMLQSLFDNNIYRNSFFAFTPVMTSYTKEGKDPFFTWLKKSIENDPSILDYINYYEISKDEFKEMVDLYNNDQKSLNPDIKQADINVDILYSGDKDEIDEYYSVSDKNVRDIDISYYDWYYKQ